VGGNEFCPPATAIELPTNPKSKFYPPLADRFGPAKGGQAGRRRFFALRLLPQRATLLPIFNDNTMAFS